jgi:hypothetical protein
MFVLAQYLGWVEIRRRDIGFLDLGDRHRNRKLVELLSVIRRVLFAVDLDPVFHVPAGHQRAVGGGRPGLARWAHAGSSHAASVISRKNSRR